VLAFCIWAFSPILKAQSPRTGTPNRLPAPDEIFDAAERAMGGAAALADIHSISAIAACHGPKGDYETRIISDRDGNLSFQQFFPDHKNIAGILNGRGWQLADDGRSESIDEVETSVLRGHEFPMIAIDLRKRFHDFKTLGVLEFEGQQAMKVAMIDELGNPAAAYFSLDSHLLEGLTVTNARSGDPLTILFDSWKLIAEVKIVSHVTIRADSETYTFDFKSLDLNAADHKILEIPNGPGNTAKPN